MSYHLDTDTKQALFVLFLLVAGVVAVSVYFGMMLSDSKGSFGLVTNQKASPFYSGGSGQPSNLVDSYIQNTIGPSLVGGR